MMSTLTFIVLLCTGTVSSQTNNLPPLGDLPPDTGSSLNPGSGGSASSLMTKLFSWANSVRPMSPQDGQNTGLLPPDPDAPEMGSVDSGQELFPPANTDLGPGLLPPNVNPPSLEPGIPDAGSLLLGQALPPPDNALLNQPPNPVPPILQPPGPGGSDAGSLLGGQVFPPPANDLLNQQLNPDPSILQPPGAGSSDAGSLLLGQAFPLPANELLNPPSNLDLPILQPRGPGSPDTGSLSMGQVFPPPATNLPKQPVKPDPPVLQPSGPGVPDTGSLLLGQVFSLPSINDLKQPGNLVATSQNLPIDQNLPDPGFQAKPNLPPSFDNQLPNGMVAPPFENKPMPPAKPNPPTLPLNLPIENIGQGPAFLDQPLPDHRLSGPANANPGAEIMDSNALFPSNLETLSSLQAVPNDNFLINFLPTFDLNAKKVNLNTGEIVQEIGKSDSLPAADILSDANIGMLSDSSLAKHNIPGKQGPLVERFQPKPTLPVDRSIPPDSSFPVGPNINKPLNNKINTLPSMRQTGQFTPTGSERPISMLLRDKQPSDQFSPTGFERPMTMVPADKMKPADQFTPTGLDRPISMVPVDNMKPVDQFIPTGMERPMSMVPVDNMKPVDQFIPTGLERPISMKQPITPTSLDRPIPMVPIDNMKPVDQFIPTGLERPISMVSFDKMKPVPIPKLHPMKEPPMDLMRPGRAQTLDILSSSAQEFNRKPKSPGSKPKTLNRKELVAPWMEIYPNGRRPEKLKTVPIGDTHEIAPPTPDEALLSRISLVSYGKDRAMNKMLRAQRKRERKTRRRLRKLQRQRNRQQNNALNERNRGRNKNVMNNKNRRQKRRNRNGDVIMGLNRGT